MINAQLLNSHVGDRSQYFTHRIIQEPGSTAVNAGDEIRPQLEVEMFGTISPGRHYQAVASYNNEALTDGVSGSVILDRSSRSVKLGFPGLRINTPGNYRLVVEFFEAESDGSAQLIPCGDITTGTITIKSRD